MTFGLVQSDPNEFSPNRKTTFTLHLTKLHRTTPKLILIGAGASVGAGVCNRKTAL
jgi:hypothetical protein